MYSACFIMHTYEHAANRRYIIIVHTTGDDDQSYEDPVGVRTIFLCTNNNTLYTAWYHAADALVKVNIDTRYTVFIYIYIYTIIQGGWGFNGSTLSIRNYFPIRGRVTLRTCIIYCCMLSETISRAGSTHRFSGRTLRYGRVKGRDLY